MSLRSRPSRLPILVTLALLPLFVLGKVFEHLTLHTRWFDTGLYERLIWNLSHGRGFLIAGHSHLGEHFSPIVVAFVPLFWVAPSGYWLMIAQGLAVGLTVWPLLWLADEVLGGTAGRMRWAARVGVVLAMLLYPPIASAWRWEFQPIVLGMPMVAAAVVAMHRRSWLWLAIGTALLLTTRESAPLSVLGLAIYAGLVLHQKRPAVLLMIAAAITAAVVFGVIMPMHRDAAYHHIARLDPLGLWQAKLAYLVLLVAPLGFIPLLGWRALLAAVPGILLNLSVGYEQQFSMRYHYDAQLGVFVLIAFIHGLKRLATWSAAPATHLGRVRRGFALAVAGLLLVILSGGGVVRDTLAWLPTSKSLSAAHALAAMQPAAATPVASAGHAAPHLCLRPDYFPLSDSRRGQTLPDGATILLYVGPHNDATWNFPWFFRSTHARLIQQTQGIACYRWEYHTRKQRNAPH